MPSLLTPFLQKQRLAVVEPFLRGDVLDLGCGLALISEMLRPNQIYVGVESPPAFIDWLHVHRPQHSFYQRDLDQHPLNLDRQFDTIVMVAVIEHLERPGYVLSQIGAHLKTNGRLVITSPSPLGDRLHQIGARLGLFSKEAMHEHETIFTREDLKQLAGQNGLALIDYRQFLLGGNQLFVFQATGAQSE